MVLPFFIGLNNKIKGDLFFDVIKRKNKSPVIY